jgi:hypothetical protein
MLVVVVALLTAALAAASTVSGRARARVATTPVTSYRPAALRASTMGGCYTHVSCLDTSVPKDAPCNDWKWDADL